MSGLPSGVAEWVSRTFGVLIERLVEVRFIQTGVVLAAQTFMALIPLLMAVTALFPPKFASAVSDWMRDKFGLSGSTEQAVQQLVVTRDEFRGSITVAGVVLIMVSATAFTRALQRMYEQAWGLPHKRGGVRGVAWLAGLVAYTVIVGAGAKFVGTSPAGFALRAVLATGGAVLLWWWTPYVLLRGRVRARALLPCGLLTGAAMLMLGHISSIVVPRTVQSSESRYGTIGTVFAFQSWLVVTCCTIVLTAVISAVMAQADTPAGRLARGAAEPDGWRRILPT